jgi:hypothetical protein
MHSFTSSLHHCVFATKGREPWLTPDIRERLWPYLGGIARENDMKTLAIGGVADHVHILLSLSRLTYPAQSCFQILRHTPAMEIHGSYHELGSSVPLVGQRLEQHQGRDPIVLFECSCAILQWAAQSRDQEDMEKQ